MKRTEEIKQSVCRIRNEDAASQRECTGWLCSSDGWIISAGHLFVSGGNVFDKRTAADAFFATVQFPSTEELRAELIYAEKDNEQGIDFAILQLVGDCEKIHPLLCADYSEYSTGKVHITGLDRIASGYITGYDGEIQSEMVALSSGTTGFILVDAANAVQEGYSGSPVFSKEANAVIGIQTMASTTGLKPNPNMPPVAGRHIVGMLPISRMLDRFPPLKEHVSFTKRPFSGIDLLEMIMQYSSQRDSRSKHKFFDDRLIDEIILPRINEQKKATEIARDLNQPVLNAVERMRDKNCYLLGEQGGCGKTVALFSLFSLLIKKCKGVGYENAIPVYVELRNMPIAKRGIGWLVPEYLKDNFLAIGPFSEERLVYDLWNELKDPSISGTRYTMLFDGLNEVSLSNRSVVMDEIIYWAKKEHVQVILTSRYKEERLIENNADDDYFDSYELFRLPEQEEDSLFQLLTIQKLKPDIIRTYMETHGMLPEVVQEVINNKIMQDILCIPMYLTIFTRLALDHPDKRLSDICTKGQLLYEAFGVQRNSIKNASSQSLQINNQIGNRTPVQDDVRRKLFVFDKILPYIAFALASSEEHTLGISEEILRSQIEKLFMKDSFMSKRAELFVGSTKTNPYSEIRKFSEWREILADGYPSGDYPVDWVIRFIVEELHLMRTVLGNKSNESGEYREHACQPNLVQYEFLHENLRDYFAAIHMREDIFCFTSYNIAPNISLAEPNIPRTVLEFLGDLCEEYEFRPFYDYTVRKWLPSDPQRKANRSFIEKAFYKLRGKHDPVYQNMVSNLVEIMKYSRKNDLSGVDFHDLDFTKTWLNGIRFSRSYENQRYAACFDSAVIQRSNLIRSGHDKPVVCVRRDNANERIIYSADTSGRIIRWSIETGVGEDICSLDTVIRDIVISTDNRMLYAASEHDIYQVLLSDSTFSRVHTTKAFISGLRTAGNSLCYKTDSNPVVWTELELGQDNCAVSTTGMVSETTLWLVSKSCESCDCSWIIAGGFSKASRAQVFHRNEDGSWNRKPVQTLPLPFGHHMACISMSKDETKVLLCTDKCLYEYSIRNKMIDAELMRYSVYSGCSFADYLYNRENEQVGIICAEGTEIVILDNDFQPRRRFVGGNDSCYLSFPIQIEREQYEQKGIYRFSRLNGMNRTVVEKYLLCTRNEIQEFDSDTNVCCKISRGNNYPLGYNVEDRELFKVNNNGIGIYLKDSLRERIDPEATVYVDYVEMKGSASYSIQRRGRQIIIYDKYTDERDSFLIYNGLIIQGCSMKNLDGDMSEPKNIEILRRYGAII